MVRLGKLYGVSSDVLKKMYRDGVINPNIEYYLEIYEHYQEMCYRYDASTMDAVYDTIIHYGISTANFYNIKKKIEGLSVMASQIQADGTFPRLIAIPDESAL